MIRQRLTTTSSSVALSARAMRLWLMLSSTAVLIIRSSIFVEGLIHRCPPVSVRTRTVSSRNKKASSSILFQLPPSQSASPFDENVYIQQRELEAAIRKEQERHEKECHELQQTIEQQRRELQQLRDNEHKERLKQKMYHDATCSENLTMLWSENHSEKMRRFQGRLQYLTDENLHLQAKLEMERSRHEEEIRQLEMQLEIEQEKTQDAKNILGLERAYYETSVTLLEKGLEREGRKVKALQTKLKEQQIRQQRRMGQSREEPLPQRNIQLEDEEPEEERVYETYHYNEHRHDREEHDRHMEQFHYPSSFQPRPRQNEQHRPQPHHSDQYGYEQPYHPGQEQHDGGGRRRKYYPPYSSSVGGQSNNARPTSVYRHRPNPRTATRNGRTTIPTMNGQNLGSDGINDMRSRLY